MLRNFHKFRFRLPALTAIFIAAVSAVTPARGEGSGGVFAATNQRTAENASRENLSRPRSAGATTSSSDVIWPWAEVANRTASHQDQREGGQEEFSRTESIVAPNRKPRNPLPTPADEPESFRLPPPTEEESEQTPLEELPPPQQPFVGEAPRLDSAATIAPYSPLDFGPDAYNFAPPDANSADATYRTKTPVPVQRPWVEWGRGFYLPGQYPAGGTLFGPTNLTLPHYLVYGDLRTAMASNHSNNIDTNVWATTLFLENDWKWTATERVHALFTPLNRLGDVTRLQNQTGQGTKFFDVFNANPTTAFFEGDAGAILGGFQGTDSRFDMPFTVGLIPLFFQNGVWMNDAILGAAVNIPAKNSPLLDWSNYEVTFFCGFDQVTSDAFRGDNQAADVFGAATFIEAYGGYIEAGYAFLNDDTANNHSYHNLTASFTRRYFGRVSNSVRGIVNVGQSSATAPQTADGLLLLVENSLISRDEQHLVPYFNLFGGFGSPQSVARGAAAGGVLTNTGISFEIDNITNYPTLDATGRNACGGALGVELLGPEFYYQFIVETAYVHVYGNPADRLAVGDQASISGRFQVALSKSVLFRTDIIYGALQNAPDILGGRIELRHKF